MLRIRSTLSILCLASLCSGSCSRDVERPNIILIMTDDQGWYDAGFNGNEEIRTPHLDSLAAWGIILDRFYSASAVCSPTRASVLTGRNPLRTDIPYANSGHLREGEITLPEILQREGYATGHFGKWHLGTFTTASLDANRGGKEAFIDDYSLPTQHGYDEYFATESKVPTFDPMVYPASFEAGESLRYGWKARQNEDSILSYGTAYWEREGQRVHSNLNGDDARVIMDRVIPFVERSVRERTPFFATVWFHTPHLPVVSDPAHRQAYAALDLRRQLYFGTISAMDQQIGNLWQNLVKLGIEEETLIFFCSDNGPEERTPGSAGGFRGRKRSLYEGGVRVPAFVLWKGHLPGGTRSEFPMVTSDYLPTILDILQLDYPDDRPLDGVSVLPALRGEQARRDEPIGFICQPHVSWVTHRYKLIGALEGDDFELYDLPADSAEQENLIERFPSQARNLEVELTTWRMSVEESRNGADYPTGGQ